MTIQIKASDLKGRLVEINGKLFLKKTASRAVKKPRMIIPEDLIKETFARYLANGGIFIPYNAISSKNSKEFKYLFEKGSRGGKKVPRLVHSDAYRHYVDATFSYWEKGKDMFLDMIKKQPVIKPLRIKFYLIRTNHSIFDYLNMMQGSTDLMVRHGWIPDDNMKEILPIPLGYEINPECPGVVIYP